MNAVKQLIEDSDNGDTNFGHGAERRRKGRTPNPDAVLLTVEEVGALLRTSRKAIYVMAERGAIPGAVRIGRRLLFRRKPC